MVDPCSDGPLRSLYRRYSDFPFRPSDLAWPHPIGLQPALSVSTGRRLAKAASIAFKILPW